MMFYRPSKSTSLGLTLIILGALCFLAESVFYGTVDENGFLQESLFLPLSFFLGFAGLVLLAVSGIKALIRKFR